MCPRPTERWYHGFYEQEFWQEKVEYRGFTTKTRSKRAATDGLARRLAKQEWRADRILRFVERSVNLAADSLVVDIGTAFGVTLHRIRERYGCRVAGVEPSLVAREYAQSQLRIAFIGRYMEDLFAPTAVDGQVKLLIFSQVLENILNPRDALTAARRLLQPGGSLYVDTSNFVYYNAVNPYHPYIFSPSTLEALLSECGFAVVDREHESPLTEALAPPNLYLTFLARPGVSPFVRRSRSVEEIVAEQQQGLGEARKWKDTPRAR
jgi:SAM-dependent methyltransferase